MYVEIQESCTICSTVVHVTAAVYMDKIWKYMYMYTYYIYTHIHVVDDTVYIHVYLYIQLIFDAPL